MSSFNVKGSLRNGGAYFGRTDQESSLPLTIFLVCYGLGLLFDLSLMA